MIASLILLAMVPAIPSQRAGLKRLSKKWWKLLAAYGFFYYTLTQGTHFVGLALLPATMVSFILNFTITLFVILGTLFLHEPPNKAQLVLISVAMVGAYLFFVPIDLAITELLGILVMMVGLLANALSAILGRAVNRSHEMPVLVVTAVSMVIGAVVLLVVALLTTGLPVLSPAALFVILWLAVVNGALAFTLWNHAMQYLRAVETTIINSTMMVLIAILGLVLLGETLTVWDWIGIALLMTAAVGIQLVRMNREPWLVNRYLKDLSEFPRGPLIAYCQSSCGGLVATGSPRVSGDYCGRPATDERSSNCQPYGKHTLRTCSRTAAGW